SQLYVFMFPSSLGSARGRPAWQALPAVAACTTAERPTPCGPSYKPRNEGGLLPREHELGVVRVERARGRRFAHELSDAGRPFEITRDTTDGKVNPSPGSRR